MYDLYYSLIFMTLLQTSAMAGSWELEPKMRAQQNILSDALAWFSA